MNCVIEPAFAPGPEELFAFRSLTPAVESLTDCLSISTFKSASFIYGVLTEMPSSALDTKSFSGRFFWMRPSLLLKSCSCSRLVSCTFFETLDPAFETMSPELRWAPAFDGAPLFLISLFISAYRSLNSCRLMRDKCETALPGIREFWASYALAPLACFWTVHFSSLRTAESRSILMECKAS